MEAKNDVCGACGYSLQGLPAAASCPECGVANAARAFWPHAGRLANVAFALSLVGMVALVSPFVLPRPRNDTIEFGAPVVALGLEIIAGGVALFLLRTRHRLADRDHTLAIVTLCVTAPLVALFGCCNCFMFMPWST